MPTLGITSALKHFQQKMSQTLEGMEIVVCIMGDVLVYGSTQEEHDSHLIIALQASGATMNKQKCQNKHQFFGTHH